MKRLLAAVVLTVMAAGAVAGCGGKDIGRDAALDVALSDAGVSEADTTRLRVSEDRDNGRKIYDIRFDVGNTEYDYDVQASDGLIVGSDIQDKSGSSAQVPNNTNTQDNTQNNTNTQDNTQNNTNTQNNAQSNSQNTQNNTTQGNTTRGNASVNNANVAVTQEQATQTALSRVSGATEQNIRIHLDYDDGFYKYEGDIIYNGTEYEFEIDANSGNILEWSEERY